MIKKEVIDLSTMCVEERKVCGRVIACFLGTELEIRDAVDDYENFYSVEKYQTAVISDAIFVTRDERDGKIEDIFIIYLIRTGELTGHG